MLINILLKMKKILYIFSASLLVFISCSKGDNPSETINQNLILPKKIAVVFQNESILTYNGNKIVQSVSGIYKTVYTYSGDLITKQEKFAGNEIDYQEEYSYENDKLKMILITGVSGDQTFKRKKVYIHNSNGTVDYIYYNINLTTGVETLGDSGELTILNGNIVKIEEGTTFLSTIEYDNKNNVTKNILGFDKLMKEELSANNIMKNTYVFNGGVNPTVNIYQYDYNAKGYPIEQRIFYDGSGTVSQTTRFTY